MKLKRSQVEYIAHHLVKGLVADGLIEVKEAGPAAAVMQQAFGNDLMVEDRLNEEVRQILEQYSDQIAGGSVQYHEMFKLVKAKLVKERKLIL